MREAARMLIPIRDLDLIHDWLWDRMEAELTSGPDVPTPPWWFERWASDGWPNSAALTCQRNAAWARYQAWLYGLN